MNQQKAASTTSSSSNTAQNTEIQAKKNTKVFGSMGVILSILAGGLAYCYMDLTWDLICKNELIFKLYIAFAALFFG